jgi:hypothetical protein
VGYVRAFHASGDVEHESQTNYDFLAGMHSTGYGPERTTMLLSSTAHPGEEATALLRGVLPDHIQSDLCRQANAGNEDRNCGTTVIDDYTNVLFSIDDVILYFADRNGFPPDVLKAHIFQESPGTSEPNQVMFYTNMYRYEPYTWDFKEYSGCAGSYQIQGTRCSDGAAGLFRKLSVLPFCLYATGGPILDCESDGLGTDDPAHFAAGLTLTATIPAGTPRDGFELDLSTMTGAPGNFPMQAARARLYAVPLRQSPYCVDQRDAACVVPSGPSYSPYGIRLTLAGADWNQVATNTHRMLVVQHDAPHSARPLDPDEFRVYYFSGQEQVIDLGSVPTADLTVSLRPSLITEIGPGLKPLPANVTSVGAFLTDSTRDSLGFGLQFNEGSTISSWVHANWTKGADQGFLRVLEGDAGQSQNWFLLDVDGQDLYDPQYDNATAQLLLAGSFGLMQVGPTKWNYSEHDGRLLRAEYDLEAPDHHILDLVMKSWTSIQAGSAIDGYHLYAPQHQHLQTACPEGCMRVDLRSALLGAVWDYNQGHPSYGNDVFDRLPMVSPTPETWRETP